MDDVKVGAVKDLIARHGKELLDDSRRCEALLKDTYLSASEVASMMGALKQGIPQRLSAQPETVLAGVMIAKYADQLSDVTALKYEAAYSAVAMWGAALGLQVVGDPPPGRDPLPPTPPGPRSANPHPEAGDAIWANYFNVGTVTKAYRTLDTYAAVPDSTGSERLGRKAVAGVAGAFGALMVFMSVIDAGVAGISEGGLLIGALSLGLAYSFWPR